jgi:O-acetyl-ADP-ribose deacetylase (regulator of RNase III)
MQYIFIDTNPKMVEAWKDFFSAEEQVSIVEGDVTSLAVDAIVSPANSFGFMDGSLDHAISERLGWHLEKELQSRIRTSPEGELLIGQAMILDTEDKILPSTRISQ